ncbi:MAG: hypothetical protein N2036_00955, partial [Bryobacteraceae bacterium]|nr:hypothetical protein [Bryobacteraceae bacterium]
MAEDLVTRPTRRAFLAAAAAAGFSSRAAEAPAGRVAIARCHTYGPELHESLSRMLDQLGGAARLV